QEILPELFFRREPMGGNDFAKRRKGVDLHPAVLADFTAGANGSCYCAACRCALVPVSLSASRMAARKLAVEPLPLPAISKAVPWSGEVRTIGRPSVTFTAASNATVLIGISA